MIKNYSLVFSAFLCFVFCGYGQIATIDFETNLLGYSHTPSQLPSADPGDQYFHRAMPGDASIYEGSVGPYTNVSGSWMFVGSNPNTINSSDPGILSLNSINVSGFSNLELSIDFGAVPNDWDDADELRVEYNFDGGSWNTIYSFSHNNGTNNPLVLTGNSAGGTNTANGTVLTYALQTIRSNNFTGSGSNLNIRIVCDSNANYEAFGLDNIVINGIASCTPPPDPSAAITGGTPACNSTTLIYTGSAPTGTVNYWQTSPTGTSTANNAASSLAVTTTGTYYVRTFLTATSCWSSGAASYAVVINQAPSITAQPVNATRVIPAAATFSVTATNSPTYQWQVSTNGGSTWVNAAGATATNSTYNTGATDGSMQSNQYRCVVTNGCGSTISNAATLTLTNDPPNNVTGTRGCFTDNAVTIDWNPPATGPTPTGYIIFARDGADNPSGTKTDANTYTANSDFSAAAIETPATLGRVVYKGNATTAIITGLTEDANYFLTVYAYVGETLTGYASGTTLGSRVTNEIAQGDVRNLVATPLTNQVNLNWNNPLPTSCFDQLIIVANTGTVAFTPSGTYPNTDVNYTTPNSIIYSTMSTVSSKALNGLANGTNYCFKVFIRRGSNWSEGVEICAVPSLTYCASFGDGGDGFNTLINNVEFNTIDNSSDNTDNAYSDFTSVSTNLTLGEFYNLDVRVNTDGAFETVTRAWIDWNNNGTFETSELYELGNAFDVVDGSTDESPLAIEVPTNAVIAATRMRISTQYFDSDFPSDLPTPCKQGFDGEVEDYTINILQPVNAEINVKGNNISIENGFDAPYGLNNTLFGAQNVLSTSAPKSYFIENIGASTLNLTGSPRVEIIGANASDFNVTIQPSSAAINASSNSEFRIVFSPTADGQRNATVRIQNNDSNEDPYEFDIRGNAVCSTTLTSSLWPTSGPENTEVTITSANNLAGATASINGLAMPTVSSSATALKVLVPTNATSGNLSVLFSTGCSSINPFTVINNVINGCETETASTTVDELFFSQISDATSGSSSIVEIYNGTGVTKSLSGYSLLVTNNGAAPNLSNQLALSGSIAPNDVFVVSIGSTTCDLQSNGLASGTIDQSFSSAGGINFDLNSSDMIQLLNANVAVDVFGQENSNNWANGLVADGDGVSFSRRNDATNLPSTTFDINDFDQVEWSTCEDSDYSNFGSYDFSLGVPPSVSVLNSPLFNCTSSVQLSVSGTQGVSGGAGLAYQWYYLAPNTTSFIEVPATSDFNNVSINPTLDIANGLPYLDYQFYCQVRENTASCYKASRAVKLEAERAIWNGSWSSAPTSSKFVVIEADYDTNIAGQTSFEACQLIIDTDHTLTIRDNTYVLVQNNVTVNGAIIMETDASFVQVDDSALVNGDVLTDRSKITVEKKTAVLNTYQEYTYWSSPVAGETIGDGLDESSPNRRYLFNAQNFRDSTQETANDNAVIAGQDDIDDNGNDWEAVTNNTDIMVPGVGYASTLRSFLFINPARYKYAFNGPFNTGEITVPIYRNDNEGADNNWNFIGNPYPSAIDADLFLAENASIDQTIGASNGAIFFWSHNTPADADTNGNEGLNYSQSDYAIINGTGELPGGDGLTPDRYIPSGQGFFIAMDDGAPSTSIGAIGDMIETTNIIFNNEMRVTGNNAQFFRTNTTEAANKIKINLTSDNGVFNQILVGYVDGATNDDDGMYYDAHKNLSANTNSIIYSLIDAADQRKYAIQGKAPSSLSLAEVIPLGFYTTIDVATLYTLSIASLEGVFMTDNTIFVRDYLSGIVHDLSANDYIFTSETGEFNDRFEIVFQSQTLSAADNEITKNGLTIIELNNGDVKFSVENNLTIKHIDILDILGRTIYKLKGQQSTETYDLSRLPQSAYFARVTLSNGQVITKKAMKIH
ncbi:MAG: GEVED domain-containing protein [Psychroserpens sp.]|uniref:GEVED domain-containing protein n=1 Tax=Psychroserpens sp. TaxID=2020870 RepID=UPI003C9BC97F